MRIAIDLLCYNGCGYQEDALVDRKQMRGTFVICPLCGEWARRFHGYAGKVGVVSTPKVVGGEVFHSNAEEAEFMKKHVALVKGTPDEQRVADRIRGKAEELARRQGFRDLDDRTSYFKREMAKGWNPNEERRKVREANKRARAARIARGE
jgi:hypothetical protein